MKPIRRVLILAPHTDDGELGCGGTIARLCAEGREVYYVAFSAAEESVPREFSRDALRKEVLLATGTLGILQNRVKVLKYPVRQFGKYRQEILEDMVRLRNFLQPDLVFLPASGDTHQDHAVVNAEGRRAFRHISLLGYEAPWNQAGFHPGCFVSLKKSHLERKIAALRRYKTQQHRPYFAEDFVRSLARMRGVQAGVELAEAFEVLRWVL
ncbi:PIG-L deacetylase family protein [Calderihabitans maritimus]|uniref:LmbE family protein n=1 Tax=Calderihabitans maritimus TaxID=1246530 RepID=A0A1Z5HXS4_9FIRM|nr:PIG-L deacetylase family protein [Calderihabitans maritimus]GAW94080.1 hypothetical protein KKC1_31980 [Calderihabitans maritimus]